MTILTIGKPEHQLRKEKKMFSAIRNAIRWMSPRVDSRTAFSLTDADRAALNRLKYRKHRLERI